MRQKISAMVMGDALFFEGLSSLSSGGAKPGDIRKWFEAHKKKGPWYCLACEGRVGEEGERVIVYVDPDDANYFQVFHRQHAD